MTFLYVGLELCIVFSLFRNFQLGITTFQNAHLTSPTLPSEIKVFCRFFLELVNQTLCGLQTRFSAHSRTSLQALSLHLLAGNMCWAICVFFFVTISSKLRIIMSFLRHLTFYKRIVNQYFSS